MKNNFNLTIQEALMEKELMEDFVDTSVDSFKESIIAQSEYVIRAYGEDTVASDFAKEVLDYIEYLELNKND